VDTVRDGHRQVGTGHDRNRVNGAKEGQFAVDFDDHFLAGEDRPKRLAPINAVGVVDLLLGDPRFQPLEREAGGLDQGFANGCLVPRRALLVPAFMFLKHERNLTRLRSSHGR